MEGLNYNHLHYFWVVAREGSIAAASRKLGVAQPTISQQLRALEEELGASLFHREGRRLALSRTGKTAYRYAGEIFGLGQRLQEAVAGRPESDAARLNVGVADVLPKLIAHRLLEPALGPDLRIACYEGKPAELMPRLATHELDLVLSDTPLAPELRVKAYNHEIGSCGVSVFGAKKLAARYAKDFPGSLDGAPFLLPTANTVLRRGLDGWFHREGMRPRVAGEFEDSALLKTFGQAGVGLFAGPDAIEAEICRQFGAARLGPLPGLSERFYAISVERKVKHPAVLAILESAKNQLFQV